MKKSSQNGYILYEGLVALLLFTIITATLIPFLIYIQQERISIREQRDAGDILHTFIYENFGSSPIDVPTYIQGDHVKYYLNVEHKDTETVLCLSWEGRNLREQKWCLSSYRR